MAQERKRRRFTAEYKAEAVKRLEESGKALQQVAAELGVHANQLRTWRNERLGGADSGTKRNGLSEADLDVPAKLFEEGLQRREEAEALPRRQVVAEHDLLQLGVAQRVEVEVARQVAPQPPVRVLHGPFLPGGVRVAEPGRHRA